MSAQDDSSRKDSTAPLDIGSLALNRCSWPAGSDIYIAYHDNEWGMPIHDEQLLFEFICLEGQQAGLSWITVLKKREAYRQAFKNFDPYKVARIKDESIEKLLLNPKLIRNRLKLYSIKTNANAFLAVKKELGNFDQYIWSFVGGKTIQNRWDSQASLPASTPQSDAMSKDLKKRGFKFVGTTICYAFMQAAGMVNDHITTCYRHTELSQ